MQSPKQSMKRKEDTKPQWPSFNNSKKLPQQLGTNSSKRSISLMAYSDEMHARQEFELACQKRNLISELSEYQQVCSGQIANNEMMEGKIQLERGSQPKS